MKVFLVGCGALGTAIAKGVTTMPGASLTLFDIDHHKAVTLARETLAPVVKTVDDGIVDADLIVEAASQAALKEIAPKVMTRGKTLIALSVGALVDGAFLNEVTQLAKQKGGKLLVPSGALAGLDAVRGAAEGGLDEVTLVTAKPPEGFGLSGLTEAKVLYEGSATEAVKKYPKNVNVAAALSLAGIGFERTRVRIVADPALTANTHTVVATGAFGRLECRVENRPSPQNPASSYLASLAALALIRRFVQPVQIGT
ncbi:MAG: aspartate dehydrogenase [Candidatus Thermoplasmatota archaeon]